MIEGDGNDPSPQPDMAQRQTVLHQLVARWAVLLKGGKDLLSAKKGVQKWKRPHKGPGQRTGVPPIAQTRNETIPSEKETPPNMFDGE